MTGIYEDRGIRFEYPGDWELEVTDEGPLTTVAVQAPGGLAFALVTVDDSCPAPADVADQALEALREEYPVLDAVPALEAINGYHAVGHDVEFISLDMTNSCTIRCFRTAAAPSCSSASGPTWSATSPKRRSSRSGVRSGRPTARTTPGRREPCRVWRGHALRIDVASTLPVPI